MRLSKAMTNLEVRFMSRLYSNRALLSALVISCLSLRGVMGGDCGCDYQPSCQTVQHIHRHVWGHCKSCVPTGMVVPSVAAMPMAAMPMGMAATEGTTIPVG